MTPYDVVADDSRLERFQTEVAYLDRMQPPKAEAENDAKLLASNGGVRIVAWLWPSPSYEPGFDPFEPDSGENGLRSENADSPSQPVGAENALETARVALDRQRQSRLWVPARRSREILALTARAVDRPVEDLETHLEWSVPLSQLELGRLLRGHTPFPFPVIVGLCAALQLEFTDAWVLVDPQRLARSIDQSVLASRISDHLRSHTLDDLENLEGRLRRPPVGAGRAHRLDTYRGPMPGGRYASLYEALASDVRDDPDYTLAEVDRLLVDAGEAPLPDSARKDRSWWAGSGRRTEGHPQVSAWWAAGYRIGKLEIDPSSGQVAAVGFEALSGRAEWLADPERIAQREYRVPGPEKVEIYRHEHDLEVALMREAGSFEAIATALLSFASIVESVGIERRSLVPDDPDIRLLVEFLDEVGEADRAQITRHFDQGRDKPVGSSWMTNLLTRARRQGWTVNNGTRSRPRWASTTLTTRLMLEIAENLNLEPPAIEPVVAVPVGFLRDVAKTVGVDAADSSAPQIARRIIESVGGTWQPEFESADRSSVTGLGLKAVRDAIGMPIELHTDASRS